jgi:hypothetical protein
MQNVSFIYNFVYDLFISWRVVQNLENVFET